MYFKDKVIWVTGASSGIGRATAIALSKKAAKLIISGRHASNLLDTKKACQNPNDVHIIPFDLAQYADFKHITQTAIAVYGHIDILINNGGISQRALAENTSIAVDEQIMKVNYLGTVALTKALLPHFIERSSGRYVVVTSVTGKIGTPLRSSYAASKHALHGFFDSLRAEVYKYNIKVTLICPGFVQTNVSKNALTGNGKPQDKMDKSIQNGITAERLAKEMLRAIKKDKQEKAIGHKEIYGILIKRFFPKLAAVLIRKIDLT
jgi:short-subunit dehydrogenase